MMERNNRSEKDSAATPAANGWALTPSKYIEFIDHDLDINYEKEMLRIQREMKKIMLQEKKSQKMLEDAFKGIGYGID